MVQIANFSVPPNSAHSFKSSCDPLMKKQYAAILNTVWVPEGQPTVIQTCCPTQFLRTIARAEVDNYYCEVMVVILHIGWCT